MPTPSDQRRFHRQSVEVQFKGRDVDGLGELTLEGADLSAGGAFIKSDVLLEDGELLFLEFHLPGQARLFHAQAKVAWSRKDPRGDQFAGMGLEFLEMSDEDRGALENALRSS